VKTTGWCAKITVSADGSGIVSQAGGLLLARTLQVTGMGRGFRRGWRGGGSRGRSMIRGRSSPIW